ncbi:hypothetical protein [Bradyrhizobium neotropicale]|uniref:hypothetical protein n=1 Tax=Bradyrhizobium neotropicale TaxID=1497615 RepID=UPI001AD6A70B|nr:hypothetical protein [Bradyrhizobium neotropicale]MBO4226862.1 hypothetical protein [Bradyrhizobium neotropicale]
MGHKATSEAADSGDLQLQLCANSITVLDVQHLTCIKVLQKYLSFRWIVAEAREVYNPLLLLSNVSFASATCRSASSK